MCLSSIDMPRKPTSYRIDERILTALEQASREGNISVNRYLENLLFSHLKQVGKIAMGEEPLGETRGSEKGEARGGKRKGAGKPKRSHNDPLDTEKHSSKDSGGSSESLSVTDVDAIVD